MSAVLCGRVVAILLALAAAAAVVGCLGDEPGRDAVAPVPESELREPGALSVCTDATRPPLEYRASDGVLRGFEVDLLSEIAERLELTAAWVDADRDEVAAALAEGRCDAAASTLTVRRDGGGELGRIAAVAYVAVPVSLLVRRGERALAVTGLCGRRVGVLEATRERELVSEYAEACRSGGRPRLEIVAVADTPGALDRLHAGEIDALLAEHPVNDWFARRQTDRFDLGWILGEEVVRWAIGIDAAKAGIYGAIRVTLRKLHEDGMFRELLARWGLDRTGAVPLPVP